MDAAVAVVLGAALGASASLGGSLVTAWTQARREVASWQRQRRQDAYSNAIRVLIRVDNRRRKMAKDHHDLLPESERLPFFDELADAQHWLSMLVIACGADQRATLDKVRCELNELVIQMLPKPTTGADLERLAESMDAILSQVDTAARHDSDAEADRRTRLPFGRAL